MYIENTLLNMSDRDFDKAIDGLAEIETGELDTSIQTLERLIAEAKEGRL